MHNKIFTAKYFRKKHAIRLCIWMSREKKLRWFSSQFKKKPHLKKIKKYYKTSKSCNHRFYSMFDKNFNHIGHFELKNINSNNKSAVLAHVLLGDSTYRGKGFGKAFIAAILALAFGKLNLHRLGLAVHTNNHRAIFAYLKAGFQFEGLIRDALKIESRHVSLYQMSILRTEWKKGLAQEHL